MSLNLPTCIFELYISCHNNNGHVFPVIMSSCNCHHVIVYVSSNYCHRHCIIIILNEIQLARRGTTSLSANLHLQVIIIITLPSLSLSTGHCYRVSMVFVFISQAECSLKKAHPAEKKFCYSDTVPRSTKFGGKCRRFVRFITRKRSERMSSVMLL